MPLDRYCRQTNLLGKANQLKLAKSSVLVIGAGGIGSPALLYLVAGGVGTVGFVDHDVVALSNLHRQVLFTEKDIGSRKSEIAYQKLKSINSEINLVAHNVQLNIKNASNIFLNHDLIIDGSDNFRTRYLVNDICCQLDIPFISASIFQNTIQVIFFDIKQGCYRCIFPEPPPPFLMNNCSDAGVLGPTTGIAGSIATSLAIQFFINQATIPVQKIITFDSNTLESKHFSFLQREHCLSCYHKLISWPSQNFNLELQKIDLADYKIIDIRELNEDRGFMLTKNELHIPFSKLLELPIQIPKDKLLLYCHSGTRSDYAANFLRKKGFNAFSLNQGISSVYVNQPNYFLDTE